MVSIRVSDARHDMMGARPPRRVEVEVGLFGARLEEFAHSRSGQWRFETRQRGREEAERGDGRSRTKVGLLRRIGQANSQTSKTVQRPGAREEQNQHRIS